MELDVGGWEWEVLSALRRGHRIIYTLNKTNFAVTELFWVPLPLVHQ